MTQVSCSGGEHTCVRMVTTSAVRQPGRPNSEETATSSPKHSITVSMKGRMHTDTRKSEVYGLEPERVYIAVDAPHAKP